MVYEQSQLRALIETAVDGIISIDADGIIGVFNPAAAAIFGHAPEAVLGQRIEMLMPAPYREEHGGYVSQYLSTGEAKIIGIGRHVEGLRADGTRFPLHLSVGEYTADGARHFVGIIRDRTAEVEAQRRAQSLTAQLELIGRHAAVSEMGAALAHELNQPLTAIDLFLVAAERKLQTEPEGAAALFARVRHEAQRAGSIVRRIRQMVERSDGEKTPFDLTTTVTEAVELCQLVDAEGAVFEQTPLPPMTVFGDQVQVRMILVNLLSNALEATKDRARPTVAIRGRIEAGMAIMDVADNGPGVSPEFEARLFEPFESTKARGLGIGLSICSTIAETHGGRLAYVPPSRQANGLGGAMFRLELPCRPTEADG